ncbi:Tetraspanin-6 [Lucilia cuprina]|nr:Tetraspanin-6 [Lucilia cuprina]
MGLSDSTIKKNLLFLNFIFVVFGLILIFIGIVHFLTAEHLQLHHKDNFMESIFVTIFVSMIIKVIGLIIIAVGVIVTLFAMFGCWAAIRESKTKLIIYFSALTILVLVQLLLITIGVTSQQNDTSDTVNSGFDRLWLKENYQTSALAEFENLLQCCGVNSTDDYRRIDHEIPESCCKDQNCTIPENVYKEGCESKYKEYMHNRVSLLNIVIILLIFAEVLGLILISFGIFILISGAENKVDHGENVAGGVIITLGIIILIIAIFGCLAAIHESKRKLIIYVLILTILILIQLLLTSMASHGTQDGLAGSVKQGFDELWILENKEPGALAYYEDWLHCCGVNSTEDYRLIKHEIPKTCCKEHNCASPDNIYTEGCQIKFEEYLSDKMLTFTIVNILLIIGEIIAAIFGWLLYSSLKNESRRSNLSWM